MVMAMIARRWSRRAVWHPTSGFGARMGASMRDYRRCGGPFRRSAAGTLPDGGEVGTKLTI